MSAVVPKDGRTRLLDKPSEPDEQVTPELVRDADRLARLLMRALRSITEVDRRFLPQWLEHEDFDVDGTGTTLYRFPHGFGARVRWWITDWLGASAGPQLVRHSASDDNTLVLVSYVAGTLTLRIEEAG